MNLLTYFSPEDLQQKLRVSNYWAHKNSNHYPLAIEDAIAGEHGIYEWIDCPCNKECDCKKHGCEKHLVRKSNATFYDVFLRFLDCYVNEKIRKTVERAVMENIRNINGRAANAVPELLDLKRDFNEYPRHEQHLLCTNWCPVGYVEQFAKDFRPSSQTIYKSKILSMLYLDVFVAYDTESVRLLKKDFPISKRSYYSMMSHIREALQKHLNENNIALPKFRIYDKPNEFFIGIPNNATRPIGNTIDKLYLNL